MTIDVGKIRDMVKRYKSQNVRGRIEQVDRFRYLRSILSKKWFGEQKTRNRRVIVKEQYMKSYTFFQIHRKK